MKAAPAHCDTDPRWRNTRFIDKGPGGHQVDSFNMALWMAPRTSAETQDVDDRGCNTIGCIAGTTVSLFRREAEQIMEETSEQRLIWAVAAEILGLVRNTAVVLFRGTRDGRMNLAAISREEAATACDKTADECNVDDIWSHVPMG